MTQQSSGETPRVARPGARIRPITMYGAAPCEDTAITRSRLVALEIPFRELDVDLDAQAAREQRAANGGRRATPTLVFGTGQLVVVEPTLEGLREALATAGYLVESPKALLFPDDPTGWAISLPPLPVDDGEAWSMEAMRGRCQVALFIGHDAGCLACFGYARQLAALRTVFANVQAIAVIVGTDTTRAMAAWRHGVDGDVPVLADTDGSWKRAVAARVGAGAEDVLLVVLDQTGSLRARSISAEAGGLIEPSEATELLRSLRPADPAGGGETPGPTA